MIYYNSDGSPLIISTGQSIDKYLNSRWIPCVVLMTAWTNEIKSWKIIEDLIILLLDKGTTNFVCVGNCSKQLHDQIDEIIYKYDQIRQSRKHVEVVTSYHDNEPVDDITSYYIYGTELKDKKHGCLLAILDCTIERDKELEIALKKSLKAYQARD